MQFCLLCNIAKLVLSLRSIFILRCCKIKVDFKIDYSTIGQEICLLASAISSWENIYDKSQSGVSNMYAHLLVAKGQFAALATQHFA